MGVEIARKHLNGWIEVLEPAKVLDEVASRVHAMAAHYQ